MAMYGRKTYAKTEIENSRAIIAAQLDAYKRLAGGVAAAAPGAEAQTALRDFEPLFFNNLTLALDRMYVHRLRYVAGKEGAPLNEVELISDSLMSNGGVLKGNSVVKYDPARSVLGLKLGDRIHLTAGEFERLAAAYFQDLEAKFGE